MKIAIAQLNFQVGNFDFNKNRITDAIDNAIKGGADLVIFPELAVSGYPPYDLLEFDSFIDKCYESLEELAVHSRKIAIVIGAPLKNPESTGKPLFNAAFLLKDGKIDSIARKTLIPDYDIFDEYRYFEPNKEFSNTEIKGHKVALTVCEDIWNVTTPLYHTSPLEKLTKNPTDFIINISASPFSNDQNRQRLKVLRENALKYKLPLFYVNQVGAQTELIFDGGSAVLTAKGEIYEQLPFFEECIRIYDLEKINRFEGAVTSIDIPETELIYKALVCGIRDYFKKTGLKSAVLGLSGGIDSAVTAALLVHALGKENVTGLLLPSQYSSGHSVDDAARLAENLGISHHIIPVRDIFNEYLSSLESLFIGKQPDITEENLQARVRVGILMAFSNKFGHILINTSNKSEIAVGYGTLYGDLCGGLSVLGDVYKTRVYQLAEFINRNEEIIPANSILKPPSAELKPGQLDSDSLPDYPVLDAVLFQYIEEHKSARQIIDLGFDEKLVNRVLKMVNNAEYKRYQAAPVLRVSKKAFGKGRRIPITAKFDF